MMIKRCLAIALVLAAAGTVLSAFHEVVYPIWHTAYPEKDIAMLKSLVPQVNELAANVYAAKLPGILRDKQAKYDAGLAEFRGAVDAYNAAAEGADEKALLDAAEVLHARYEGLVRILRPVLKEMDAFHKVLYVVYHTALPGQDWAAVRAAAPDLKGKAEAVAQATLPARLQDKSEAFAKAAADLVGAATDLAALGPNTDGAAVERAVQKLHARYQDLEKIFD